MGQNTTAYYLLEGLNELGIDYIFGNFGTDYAPIIEEMAKWQQENKPYPQVILCPHENVAIHMAGGYAMATGRGQVTMVHVDAGTANAAMGMHNLFRSRVPVFLMAGKAPFTIRGELTGSRDTYVHFVQDPFDMTSVVRPYVKWEYNLPHGVVTKEVLRRGYSIAQSDPKGPVYLTLPREVLAATVQEEVRSFDESRFGPVPARGTDGDTVLAIVEKLLQAENPAILTAYAGRNQAMPALLEALSMLLGIAVYHSSAYYLNISQESPTFAGFLPENDLANIDVGILLDVDVPWMPQYGKENRNTYWIHIDVDAGKRAFPLWGFASNLSVEGDSFLILRDVLKVVQEKMTPELQEKAQQRLSRLRQHHDGLKEYAAKMASEKGSKNAINPHYVCAEISRAMQEDDILVQEAVMNAPAALLQIARTKPGTYYGLGGGGLGFSGGAALGIKLANRDKRVIHLIGDGSFYFSTPTAVYAVAQQEQLPIFTVIFDNGGWQAVKDCTLKVYPEGAAKARDDFQARIHRHPHLEKVGEAFGTHGEWVEDPDVLPAAIARSMQAIAEGKAAILVATVQPF
jgi:acetolactate synthase-1/2/3 large subunit